MQKDKVLSSTASNNIGKYLKASFKMDMDILDKSAIFFPHTAHDLYFTFLVGTTSADFNMAAISAFQDGRYEKITFFANNNYYLSFELLRPYILIFTHAFKTSMLIFKKQTLLLLWKCLLTVTATKISTVPIRFLAPTLNTTASLTLAATFHKLTTSLGSQG